MLASEISKYSRISNYKYILSLLLFSCSLFCYLNLAHFLYLFYIERVQFLRQNHIRFELISRMFYYDSHFS